MTVIMRSWKKTKTFWHTGTDEEEFSYVKMSPNSHSHIEKRLKFVKGRIIIRMSDERFRLRIHKDVKTLRITKKGLAIHLSSLKTFQFLLIRSS